MEPALITCHILSASNSHSPAFAHTSLSHYCIYILSIFFTFFSITSAHSQTPHSSNSEQVAQSKSSSDLDTIVVTGSREEQKLSDTAITIEVISREMIQNSGAENAADILEEQVGVQISRSFRGSGIQLQGFDSKQILILVDGERQIGRIDGVINLSRFAADQIERIEIVKGPSSALYGSEAMGGVINIITRKNKKQKEVRFRVALGSFTGVDVEQEKWYSAIHFNDLNIGGHYSLGKWYSQLDLNFNQMNAYDLDPSDIATSASEFQRVTTAYKTTLKVSKNFLVRARTSYTKTDLQGIDISDSGAVYDRYNVRENFSVSLTPKWKLSNTQNLVFNANYQLFRDQFVLDQRGSVTQDKDEDTKEKLSQLGLQYNHGIRTHMITLGSEGFFQFLESARLKSGDSQRYRGAVYAQDEWTINQDPLLILVTGARADFDSQFGTWGSPKIAVRLDPIRSLSLRASYGIGYRAPSFKELFLLFENTGVGYVVEGNPNVNPEKSHSVNAGIEYNLLPFLYLSLNGFYNQIEDLIATQLATTDRVTMLQRFTYANIARARTTGFDLSSRFILSQSFQFTLGYTLTKADNLTEKRALSGVALHRGVGTIQYLYKPLQFKVNSSIVLCGMRPFYVSNSDGQTEDKIEADSYVTWDIRIAKQIHKIELFLQGENLLKAGDHDLLPIQPQTFLGGLSGRL